MGGSEKGRQKERWWIEGRTGGGQNGRGLARSQGQRHKRMVERGTRGKGAGGMGAPLGGWEPGAP